MMENLKSSSFLYENQKKWVKGKTIEDINKHLRKMFLKMKLNLNFKNV